MARTTIAEVQSWLSDNRVILTEGDLSEQIEEYVLSRLDSVYDVVGWTDETDTPDLVRQIIALLDAATILRKSYSDQDDDVPYAVKLEAMAEAMLMKIESGQMSLMVGDVVISQAEADAASIAAGPLFFPTEAERLDTSVDAQHTIKFKMGEVF